ncbi:MAG: heme-dependent oxidative N-demethylase subunit alpha family protein, partial [Pseudomonadota bacterium]
GGLAGRVQRLFDGLRPGRPLWRANWLLYTDPALHAPRSEGEGGHAGTPRYIRSERQTLVKFPETGAVVFSIKTDVVPLDALPDAARAALPDAIASLPEAERAYKGTL